MNKKFFWKSTLSGLLFAVASTSIYAQKKTINDILLKEKIDTSECFNAAKQPNIDTITFIPAIGYAGFAISHYNPVISIGFKVGKNKKHSYNYRNKKFDDKSAIHLHRYSLYIGESLYAPLKPFHEAHAEYYTGGYNPRLYEIGLYVHPLARSDLIASNENLAFGGGILLVNKEITGVPELSSANKLAIGYTGILGMDITPLLYTFFPKINNRFPRMKNRLQLEGTLSFIPESTLSRGLSSYELSKKIDSLDIHLFRISLGFRYFIK